MSQTQSQKEIVNGLLSEVIQTLSAVPALWTNCCGPTEDNGLSSSELLTQLQQSFPETDWTLELLNFVLKKGRQQGALKEIPVNTWYLNRNMIANNPCNSAFQFDSMFICGPPPCQKTVGVIL